MVLAVKNPPASVGDLRDESSIPGLGRSLGGGHDNPLQHSCLENPKDRGVWWAMVHRIAKSQTQLKRLSTQHAQSQAGVGRGGGRGLDRSESWYLDANVWGHLAYF